jgi:hypothetical protein
MENKLEQLLNSLIEKGWLPRWDKNWKNNTRITNIYFRQDENGKLPHIRMIVSKESNLWQFVCENGMVEHKWLDIHSWEHTTAEHSDFWFTDWDNYEYYIIESSLKDEDELEDFLLSNIKAEW